MLAPGTVIKVPVAFKQGEDKYLVIVDVDMEAHCLVINSRINPLFGRPPFRENFVRIEKSTHAFMHHSSYVDCNEVKRLPLVEVRSIINAEPERLLGKVATDLRLEVIEAIERSPCFSPREKERYGLALQGA